RFQTCSSRIF
ncbi:unnamed protein product, partial [Allacma fusca]